MKTQRRGKNLSLAGAVLQAGFTVAMLVIGTVTDAKAAVACAWLLAGGVGLWLMGAILFYCRQLERQEQAELAELAGDAQTGTIFEAERDLSLRPARARVAFVDRWIVPGFTLLLIGYLVAMGVLVLMAVRFLFAQRTLPPITHLPPGVLFSVLVGFVGFLFSRYATGMSSRLEWRPLRAAASYLLLCTLAVAAVIAGLVCAWWGYRRVDLVIAAAIPIAQFVLSAEMLVGLILDLYRPRVPGRERRLTFDSRLCSLLAEPGRVGHSIAETLSYQFGFDVSGTWFYRLLSKAIVPLIVFAAAVLVGVTSVVVVYEGQQCVVLHWGRRDEGRLLGPGVHLKWPWPVDTAKHFDTRRIHELRVGEGGQREPVERKGREVRLWTEAHGRYRELDFLLAIPPRTRRAGGPAAATQPAGQGASAAEPPPVNIIKLVVSVQYRIADVYKFGYRYVDAPVLLEGVAYREMVRYCASATLDTESGAGGGDRPEAIMTSGWAKASKALGERIRREVGPEGLDLGVEITSVRLISVHPHHEAAEAFEAVLAAERQQDEMRYRAEGEANRMLAKVAGDPDSALELALAIRRLEQFRSLAGVRANGVEYSANLRRYVRQTVRDLAALLAEIHREGLLGKLPQLASSATRRADAAAAAGLAESLAARLADVAEDLRKQDADLLRQLEQIGRDPLLRTLDAPGGAAQQRLAGRYAAHLLDLLGAWADSEGFDFAGRAEAARNRADALFARAGGASASLVAAATSFRWRHEMGERARVEPFQKERLAYEASPDLYLLDRWLDVWDLVLPNMTKYVLGVDRDSVELWLNWERQSRGLEGAFESGSDGSGG